MTAPEHSLTGLRFAKGHGTGNDFVLVADPEGLRELTPEQIARICDQHRGIGADGLIRAVPSRFLPEGEALLKNNPAAQWFMDYYNADGSLSEMCGNGVRVFVHFLLTQGLVALEPGQQLAIGTRAGSKTVSLSDDGYCVDMGPWDFIFPSEATTKGSDSHVAGAGLPVAHPALSITMGNPHTVIALANLAELAAVNLEQTPEVTPLPPQGTNVEFTVPAVPMVRHDVGYLTMRVHERGVGETLSCGTGACAAAAATRYWAGHGAPNDWRVTVPGGELGVRFFPGTAGLEYVQLSGPAVIVAEGVLASGLFD